MTMKHLIFTIVALCFGLMAKAQVALDTISAEALNEMLIEQVERLAEDGDEDTDYEELLENYIFFSENPVNLNSDEIIELLQLRLINVFQYEELQQYRRYYGDFLFIDELAMVEGFDEQTIAVIAPIVRIGKDDGKDRLTLDKLARHGKHQIVGRYEQFIERQQAYEAISDSAWLAKPNSRFLGSRATHVGILACRAFGRDAAPLFHHAAARAGLAETHTRPHRKSLTPS